MNSRFLLRIMVFMLRYLGPWVFLFSGLAVTMGGGIGVWTLLKHFRRKTRIPRISKTFRNALIQARWIRLVRHPDRSGIWVGHMERFVFFCSLLLLRHGGAGVVAAWLAFKVAAKWEAWNHMAFVPDEIRRVPPLLLARARRIWAAQGYATFVIGTWTNFLLAALGVAIAKLGPMSMAEIDAWVFQMGRP
jgi:hypothetical protein